MSSVNPLQGFTHRRRRGAELFLLILSLLVGVGAYIAVGVGVEGAVPADFIGYGGWLAVLCVLCHVVVRVVAPYADPVLLPVVAALNGLGLAMIHRIDLAELAENPDANTFARDQLIWMTLGVITFIGVLLILRDHRRLQAFTYTSGLAALVLLVMPLLPVLGTEINGARIWINVGPFSFQPGEVAKVCLVVFFAGYLVLHRDALALAGRRFAGIDFPRGRDLGPILVMWLVSLGVLVFQQDLGSSLLFFGLFLVMLYVATERPGWLVVGSTLFAAGAYVGYLLFPHVQARFDAWLHPFRLRQQLPDRAGHVRPGVGRSGRPRPRPGRPDADPVLLLRLHRRRDGRGARPDRRHGDHRALRPDRRARPAHRPGVPRRLRQAGRDRSRGGLRAPGLRGRRRRHQADPAHGSDHPVHVLRGVLPDRELGHHRPASAHLRPGASPAARPGAVRPTTTPPRW